MGRLLCVYDERQKATSEERTRYALFRGDNNTGVNPQKVVVAPFLSALRLSRRRRSAGGVLLIPLFATQKPGKIWACHGATTSRSDEKLRLIFTQVSDNVCVDGDKSDGKSERASERDEISERCNRSAEAATSPGSDALQHIQMFAQSEI